jgi:asparagine synthase (glutamine-hydrolysing)
MCGICGFIDCSGRNERGVGYLNRNVELMTESLIHRGPDDVGQWVDHINRIALGHRRLAIQDLSISGHQPMQSSSSRYILVFNGEIYNFKILKIELIERGVTFRGNSDTEVLLACFEEWGIERSLKKIVGMFALALWDKADNVLTMARDRLGEKPLYYGWQGRTFMFGSELKALKENPDWNGEIDRNALQLFMRYSYIPAPHSIYVGIKKLLPGTFVQYHFNEGQCKIGNMPEPRVFWSGKEVAEAGVSSLFHYTEKQAVDALEILLGETIQEKIISDVPFGAFLSGGIDSSVVVSLMQANNAQTINTFTIGFHESSYDEAKYAKSIAAHLGTNHTELYVTPRLAMDVIPKLPILYDEPFSDSSQIPTFLVSEMTKQHVTVALSGDGGDELFGGYNRYFLGQALWENVSYVPSVVLQFLSRFITRVSPQMWDQLGRYFRKITPQLKNNAGDKLYKLAELLTVKTQDEMYQHFVSHWKYSEALIIGAQIPYKECTDTTSLTGLKEFIEQMQLMDMLGYLPDDILTKVDRAAMGVSLETRTPFLDHRVVEFAWRIPLSMKIRNGQGKWILRQLLYKYIPKELIERPKMGFGVPIGSWLRGPLREWAESLLDESRLMNEGYLNPDPIRKKWVEHLSGKRNWQYHLWDVLMFQAWLEAQS